MTQQSYETPHSNTAIAERAPTRATRKLGAGARVLAERAAVNRERRMRSLADAIPAFVSAQNLLDQERSGHPSLININPRELKKTTVKFNNLLHDLSDHDATIQVGDIRDRVMKNPAVLSGDIAPAIAWKHVRASVVGMRNETAFEGVTCYIDGVRDVYSGSVDDDLKGIDKFVDFENVEIAVDVKASPERALNAIERNIARGHYDALPIWSGFTSEDFGSNLRINDETKMNESAIYIEEIFNIAKNDGYVSALFKLREDYSDMVEASRR